jgi:type IV secretion system protein VirD4
MTALLALCFIGLAALVLAASHGLRSHGQRLAGNRNLHMKIRVHLRLHPGPGHASGTELLAHWGRLASYREARRTRPGLTHRARLLSPDEHSVKIGTAHHGRAIRIPVQENGAIVGPPRSHKSALLSAMIIDWPGPVVVTSSKPDMYRLTARIRAERGPVWIFSPQDIGGLGSGDDISRPVRWSPLAGCDQPATAIRRALAFASAVNAAGMEDSNFWQREAGVSLQALFTAAALGARDMRKVGRWIGSARETPEATAILAQAGRVDWASKLAELNGPAEKTAATIRMVMSTALAFLADPDLAAAVMPAASAPAFSIPDFLASSGTVYMIASSNGDDDSTLGPLFAALADEIMHTATRMGARNPGGRLDPPLGMFLDEVAQICPIPLAQWTAHSGGQGIAIWYALHGWAQARARWGEHKAQSIQNTTNVKVYMPGLDDVDTLERASRLAGQAAYAGAGDGRAQRHDVMPSGMIRGLPKGYALVLRNSLSPVVIRVRRGWKHPLQRENKPSVVPRFAVANDVPAEPAITLPAALPATEPALAGEAIGQVAEPVIETAADEYPWMVASD